MKQRYRTHNGVVCIDLRLRTINQIFDSRDPSPFLERDLDDNAVDFIVSAALEHNLGTPIKLIIHIPDAGVSPLDEKTVIEAIHGHFAYDSDLTRRKIRRIWRRGQLSILIGGVLLFACLTLARSIGPSNINANLGVLREGLTIFGWVAMWRPMDMFLYSWWPQMEMMRVFTKLSRVPVEFKKVAE